MRQKIVHAHSHFAHNRRRTVLFAVFLGSTTLLATILHGVVLYSLNAMTSYGHTGLTLEERWRLMGAMEALNGWLLFGLTTAFLFGVIEKLSPSESKRESSRA